MERMYGKEWAFKVNRAKPEHLQTTEETDPFRMKRYMETERVNLPTVHSFKYLGSTIDRRGGASKVVESRVAKAWSNEMGRTEWSDLRQESPNEI